MMDQNKTPLADALMRMRDKKYIPFDVPGHRAVLSFLNDYFGAKCVELDFNSRKDIDYLCDPKGVILEAEQLAAEAFSAKEAFFLTGGTTSAVQAMIMSVCSPGDKIILPRNVHYSVIYAVIISGAIPIYINPSIHTKLGISLGIDVDTLTKCLDANSDAKAVFINNPTYYGICSDLRTIVSISHERGVKVLVDEAHGTHFYFNDELPEAAMKCGADMSAVSMHKTGGSLTQSSILLSSGSVSKEHIENIINLTRSTSSSYLLMASLDLARKNLAIYGKGDLDRIISLCKRSREEINFIGPYYAFADDVVDGKYIYDFDPTKISVNTAALGLAGVEVYTILRDQYNIQVEFGDICNFLAVSTIADREESFDALVSALRDIAETHKDGNMIGYSYEYIEPTVAMTPRDAFYSNQESIPYEKSLNRISAMSVMCYPPGIPLLAPGEVITPEIIEHIKLASQKGCSVTGLVHENEIVVVID